MKIFSYVVRYDAGFAPNPFFGWCSLACCKPDIRRDAQVGDIIVGTSSIARNGKDKPKPKLVYAMRVTEVLDFDTYWNDPRFEDKKPSLTKSKEHFAGDNIYHEDPSTGAWIQEDSLHSAADGTTDQAHVKKDTGTTTKVLLSNDFVYWGKDGGKILPEFKQIVKSGPGRKSNFSAAFVKEFADEFDALEKGRRGDPTIDAKVVKRKKSCVIC